MATHRDTENIQTAIFMIILAFIMFVMATGSPILNEIFPSLRN